MDLEEKNKLNLFARLKEKLDQPVKLSETEQVKFNELFTEIENWLAEAKGEIIALDREEAYRRANVLSRQISETQKLFEDPGYKIKKIIAKKNQDLKGEEVELVEPDDPERFRVATGPKPTAEQFQEWIDGLPTASRDIATTRLDCVKQFPEVGVDIICPECSQAAFIQCIRNEDPSFTDSATEFMKVQTR